MMLDAGFMTLADLKARILPTGQESREQWDVDLQDIGKGVAESFNNYCNRVFQRNEQAVYNRTACRHSICVDNYPIESIDTIAVDYGSGDMDFIQDDVFTLGRKAGVIEFAYRLGLYFDRVEVIYTGGFWLDDGNPMPAGATPLPFDVRDAYVRQVQSICEKRGLFHTVSIRRSESKDSGSELDTLAMLKGVKEILKRYVRYSF